MKKGGTFEFSCGFKWGFKQHCFEGVLRGEERGWKATSCEISGEE